MGWVKGAGEEEDVVSYIVFESWSSCAEVWCGRVVLRVGGAVKRLTGVPVVI